jgi:hypothetical protein
MIRKYTLFVIGAGASYELNLPLGPDLKAKIAQALITMTEESLQESRLRRALAMHVTTRNGHQRGLNELGSRLIKSTRRQQQRGRRRRESFSPTCRNEWRCGGSP